MRSALDGWTRCSPSGSGRASGVQGGQLQRRGVQHLLFQMVGLLIASADRPLCFILCSPWSLNMCPRPRTANPTGRLGPLPPPQESMQVKKDNS